MSFTGFVNAALQVGLNSIVIKPVRGIYGVQLPNGSTLPDIIAQATFEEKHTDDLEITEHPVEQGAMISDHAYKRPAKLVMNLGWSNSPSSSGSLINGLIAGAAANSRTVNTIANVGGLVQGALGIQSALNGSDANQIQAIYQSLLRLQEARALFVIYTAKRVYVNMVCESLVTETDFKSANALPITMTCKQVILVNTQTVQLPKATQATPQATASPIDKGTKTLAPVSNGG